MEYYNLIAGIIEDYLKMYPDASSLMLARMIYRDHKEMFKSQEAIRSAIRYRRGANGEHNRKDLKDKRYVRI